MRISSPVARRAASAVAVGLVGGLCITLGLDFGARPVPGLGLLIEPAFAFDGTTAPNNTAVLTPGDTLRATNRAIDGGEKAKALTALQYAADQGQPAAQWKLGQM